MTYADHRADHHSGPQTRDSWLEPDDRAQFDLVVNDQPVHVRAPARCTLADALRQQGLIGTRLGCEQGSCGACTVLLDGQPIRSCLTLAVQAEGCTLETVEQAPPSRELHALRRAFHQHGALQCGFCTSGFLMLAVGLLRDEPDATPERVREVLSANLCRCTGGVPILRAVLAAQQELTGGDR
ncbi:(2Fe-2S)-binding protein [Nonomuraea sp. NPDC050202]|jgi:carbon-monoxide dehydrogenase small subunit|uniref:(2Fe-2S)-binding protein n=1 Tax=Nonomuraea sp. NPDC050202 TaxID=3155035 RepID=UPI0033FC805D